MFESDSEDDDTTWTFKCKECGGEELDVVETRVSSRVWTNRRPGRSGRSD